MTHTPQVGLYQPAFDSLTVRADYPPHRAPSFEPDHSTSEDHQSEFRYGIKNIQLTSTTRHSTPIMGTRTRTRNADHNNLGMMLIIKKNRTSVILGRDVKTQRDSHIRKNGWFEHSTASFSGRKMGTHVHACGFGAQHSRNQRQAHGTLSDPWF